MGLADRHQALDLDESLRPGLDLLANEIVIALKKRTRFPRNPEIYRPGLVRTAPGDTLLDYVLGGVEHLHAELGRYAFVSQEAFTEGRRCGTGHSAGRSAESNRTDGE